MRKRLSILLLSAIVILDGGAFAQTQTPTMLRVPGTIDTYDASTRTLSLSTANGKVQFALPSDARIRRGGQTIDASQLANLSGYRAAVRYSESGGNRTVASVHVFGKG